MTIIVGQNVNESNLSSKIERKDDGTDSGGNCRNITHSQFPAPVLFRNSRQLTWHLVCKILVETSVLSRPHFYKGIRVLNTLICTNGAPDFFIETNRMTGDVERMPQSYCDLRFVSEEFRRISNSLKTRKRVGDNNPITSKNPYVAVMFQENGSSHYLDEAMLSQIVKQGIPNGVDALSVFITPKGDTHKQNPTGACHCNFRIEYKLDDLACPQELYSRFNINQNIIGGKNQRSSITSMSKNVNFEMSQMCRMMVNRIERAANCCVLRLVVDFVLDIHDKLWLVRTVTCIISYEKNFRNKTSLSKDEIIQPRLNANDTMSSKLHDHNSHVATKTKVNGLNILDKESEILGSTQLGQTCHGDFCRYDMKTYMARSIDLNNFDEHELPLDSKSCKVAAIRNRLLKMEHESQLKQVENKWNEATSRKGLCLNSMPLFDVTQSLIVLARKNKDKIDLCLRYHNKPNSQSDAILQDIWKENFIGGKFLAHYYRSVKVCSNCFQVYEFIKDKSRTMQGKKTKKNLYGQGQTQEIEHNFIMGRRGFSSKLREIGPMERAKLAVSLVDKSDLSEVFSFLKPSSLIIMVLSALMIMIKGNLVDWRKSRALILNPDQCYKQMCSFDIDKMSKRQVNDIDIFVKNKSFRPLNILSSSISASKICSWILGHLSFYKMREGVYTPELFDPLRNIQEFIDKLKKPLFVNKRSKETDFSVRSQISGEGLKNKAKSKKKTTFCHNYHKAHRTNFYQKKNIDELSGRGSQFGSTLSKTHILLCDDGKTRIPYEVLGSASMSSNRTNYIVCHDMFDCIDVTRLLFIDTVRKNPGCQVLIFNQAGQSGSTFPPITKNESSGENENILNNEFHADKLKELLQHLCLTDEFSASAFPYHLVGIGNGLSIALFFATKYQGSDILKSLKSIVSINGFVSVDENLAGILHSMRNSFQEFPKNRPDMPISFISKFLFSQSYIKQISINLALNIYTAVTNPISLEGRVRLIKGALQHKHLPMSTKDLNIPIFAIQSTDNAFVLPSNLDKLLDGFNVAHVFSNEISQKRTTEDCYSSTKLNDMIKACFSSSKQAIVIFVSSGHAIAQEQKYALTDFFEKLIRIVKHEESTRTDNKAKDLNETEKMPHEVLSKTNIKNMSKKIIEEPDEILHHPSKIDESEEKDIFKDTNMNPESVTSDCNYQSVGKKIDSIRTDRQQFGGTVVYPNKHISLNHNILVGDSSSNTNSVLTSAHSDDGNDTIIVKEKNKNVVNFTDLKSERKFSYPHEKIDFLIDNLSDTKIFRHKQFSFRKVPTISDYLNLSIPTELISPEVLVGPLQEKQKIERKWHLPNFQPPTADELILQAEQEFENERKREQRKLESDRAKHQLRQSEELKKEQNHRLKIYQKENQVEALQFDEGKRKRDQERAQKRMQVQVETDEKEKNLIEQGLIYEYSTESGDLKPVPTLPPTHYSISDDSVKINRVMMDNIFHTIHAESESAKKRGFLKVEEFDRIKKKLEQEHLEKEAKLRDLDDERRNALMKKNALIIQKFVRGHLGRLLFASKTLENAKEIRMLQSIVKIQSFARGILGKKNVVSLRQNEIMQLALGISVLLIQRIFRGYQGRLRCSVIRQKLSSETIQRIFRGCMGREKAEKERERLEFLRNINISAIKIQAAWRIKVAVEEYKILCIHRIASIEIQRIWRGYIGYNKGVKIKIWQETEPGPERIKLGLKMINESRNSVERQREEIDTLHRAQEKAEARASMICEELKKSEEELKLLENEIEIMDEFEAFEASPKHIIMEDEIFKVKTIIEKSEDVNFPSGAQSIEDREIKKRNISDKICQPYNSLIFQQKRNLLLEKLNEIISQVKEKQISLKNLESNLADIEEMRDRKDREFHRIQRDLMELLTEQKYELDNLRKKGIELEAATSTSATIAAETVIQAQHNENQTSLMFNQQEELMKFQFMSMSLSYFSSLNMMKQMKNIASDATNSTVNNSVRTAAAAAVASSAANISSSKRSHNGQCNPLKGDINEAESMIKKCKNNIDQKTSNEDYVLPSDCCLWSVEDVSNWLRSLSLGIYVQKFEEACVDGEFLLELKESDLLDTLGVHHKLHRRKIILSREKIRPISSNEEAQISIVNREEEADEIRLKQNIPNIDTVFSQARHGRMKRLEGSLDLGFDVNAEDERGNSVLIVAVQNNKKKLIDFLICRGANINHQNCNGNTPLHFAFSYDKSGLIAEFLIERGGDDTIENLHGLTCYDGLGKDEEEVGMI